MIKINEIKAQAKNNTKERNSIICEMKRLVKNFSLADFKDWTYNALTKQYVRSLGAIKASESFVYGTIEYEVAGLKLKAIYNNEDGMLYGECYLSEGGEETASLYQALCAERERLYNQWIEKASFIANEYFKIHMEEYCKHPLVYSSGIRSERWFLWTCGGHGTKVSKKMIELLGHICNYEVESFNDYVPYLWKNDEELNADIHLGNVVMHLFRHCGVDRTFAHDWPDVECYFELVSSENPTLHIALQAIYWYNETQKRNHLNTFEEDLERAEWFIEDGKAVAYVPVIYEDHAEFILNKASYKYRNIFKMSLCTREVPLFHGDSCCIKVVER